MAPKNLRPDPAGIFDSDVHRRVLGHLSTPDSEVGWTVPALLYRLAPDQHTPMPPVDEYGFADGAAGVAELNEILADLKSAGYAKRHAGDVWQMSQKGFDALTGPIANEPPPEAEPSGPAMILGPTEIGGKS